VLYPAPLRDILVELAASGLFRAKWTDHIHDEWIRNLLENRSDITPEQLARTRSLMDSAVLDCLVQGYEVLIPALKLPDPNDRHVLAAAIHCGADAIITSNLKDFPTAVLEPFNIEAQHPDDFLMHQFGLDQASVLIAASHCRQRLKKPPCTADQYLNILEAQPLPKIVLELRPFSAVI